MKKTETFLKLLSKKHRKYQKTIGFLCLTFSSFLMASNVITINDAIELTIKNHLDLKSFIHESNESQSLIDQAKIGTPLSLNVTVEDVLGTGRLSGVSGMETTVGVSWLLEKNIVNSRVNLAKEKTAVVELRRNAKIVELVANTSTYFFTLLSQEEELKLAMLAEQKAQSVLNRISKWVKTGRTNVIDQLRAQANLSEKKLVVEDLQHEIEVSREKLSAQWQGSLDFEIKGELSDIPDDEEIKTANPNIDNNPTFKLFKTSERITESEIEFAKTSAKPAWKVSTGLRRNETLNDYGIVAGISIPLGKKNRNQGKIAALRSEQKKQQALADAWYQKASTRILEKSHELKHNIHVAESLRNDVLPVLETSNAKAKEAYQIGSISYTEWYVVQEELLSAQLKLIEAFKNIHLLKVELERLTGTPVSA